MNKESKPNKSDEPTIKVIFPHGTIYNCIVALCAIDVGITLINADDPKDKICCLNGPMSPNKHSYEGIKAYYEDEYDFLTRGMAKGVIDLKESIILKQQSLFGSMASCASGMNS